MGRPKYDFHYYVVKSGFLMHFEDDKVKTGDGRPRRVCGLPIPLLGARAMSIGTKELMIITDLSAFSSVFRCLAPRIIKETYVAPSAADRDEWVTFLQEQIGLHNQLLKHY